MMLSSGQKAILREASGRTFAEIMEALHFDEGCADRLSSHLKRLERRGSLEYDLPSRTYWMTPQGVEEIR